MDDRIKKKLPLEHLNLKSPTFYFIKSAKFLFVFVLQCMQRENVHNQNSRWARSAFKAKRIKIGVKEKI